MLLSIFLGVFLLILAISLAISYYSFFIGAPYVFTPKKAIREMFELAQIKLGQKLYDLGAGDGRAMIIAKSEFGASTEGFELSPIVYLIGRLNLLFHRAKGAKLYFKNFYNQDLSEANVIFCFLSPHAMERLKPKFEKELKPGTKIISYSFSLHGWQPKEVIEGYPGKMFLYEI